jgi:hypothetical protein
VNWETLAEHETPWKAEGLIDLCYSIIMKEVVGDTNNTAEGTVVVKLNSTH